MGAGRDSARPGRRQGICGDRGWPPRVDVALHKPKVKLTAALQDLLRKQLPFVQTRTLTVEAAEAEGADVTSAPSVDSCRPDRRYLSAAESRRCVEQVEDSGNESKVAVAQREPHRDVSVAEREQARVGHHPSRESHLSFG